MSWMGSLYEIDGHINSLNNDVYINLDNNCVNSLPKMNWIQFLTTNLEYAEEMVRSEQVLIDEQAKLN